MFNEANEPSSACRLRRIYLVETGTPPKANARILNSFTPTVKGPLVQAPNAFLATDGHRLTQMRIGFSKSKKSRA